MPKEIRVTPEQRTLARAVVQAKINYWEALRALEKNTVVAEDGVHDDTWDDDVNDEVINEIDMLAQAFDAAGIADEDIDRLVLKAMGEE